MTAPGAPAAAGNDKSTLFGILGLVIGLICCGPAGIVLGILSINQAKQHGSSPALGWAAVIVSVLGILVNIYVSTQVL
ncbi:MAG TPA: hypothetical protein VIL37_07905 [Natronosporangium sp.]